MPRKLSNYERETIVNFNEAEDIAYIFTYNRAWQKHLEWKLGLKPVADNGFGGREYTIDKRRVRPPRVPKKLSAEARAKLVQRLSANRILMYQNTNAVGKSATKNQNE